MISFRKLSIPKKIVALTMIISGAALVVASAALLAYHFSNTRRELDESVTVLARIVADNSTAAVSFNDPTAAVETLSSLRAEPTILAACIYRGDQLFAQHVAKGVPNCPQQFQTDRTESGVVFVSAPIEWNGKEIGVVQLRASLEDAYAHLRFESMIIGGILIISGLFALALSSRLHSLVSKPILNLANTAHEVSRRKDYSIRATTQAADEIG